MIKLTNASLVKQICCVAVEPPWLRTLSERAVHLYGPPTEQGSLGHDEDTPYHFYPSMNFTCSGIILKFLFVANGTQSGGSLISPEFYLLRGYCHDPANSCEYRWLRRTQHLRPLYSTTVGGVGVYEMEFTSNNAFKSGDILGVYYPSNNSVLIILYQSGGGHYGTLDCRSTGECTYAQESILPYIAIQTQSGQSRTHDIQ